MEVINYASPNFGERAPGLSVNLLLIHYTGMKTCDQALQRLRDPSAGVSSHYLIMKRVVYTNWLMRRTELGMLAFLFGKVKPILIVCQ